jgi:YidC/Oxa1 family membrane protein insertase
MDAKRIFLYAAIFLTTLSLWTAWQREYQPLPARVQQTTSTSPVSTTSSATPLKSEVTAIAKPKEHTVAPKERLLSIKSDVLDITLDTLDAKFVSAKLLKFQQELHATDKPFPLFSNNPDSLYYAESGVIGTDLSKRQNIQFTADKKSYQLQSGQDQLTVILRGKTKEGLLVTKRIALQRGKYTVDVDYKVENPSSKNYSGHIFSEVSRMKPVDGNSSGVFNISSYTGASISDPNHKLYEKISFKDMLKENVLRTVKGGWVAIQQHYFLTAWVPKKTQENKIYSHTRDEKIFTIGMMSPQLEVPAGGQASYENQLYIGPEKADNLNALAPGLDLTIDYGKLTIISSPLFWVMKQIYRVVGNWGWSIILITVLIKLAFYRLSATSYRSMANMRKLQPRILALRERYADDKQKLSTATMELYKKEKINPLGGCLPIIIQIPVFIALYWVLLESVELRHAPFMLWIQDLAAPDPYYILPVLMGLSMLVQQKLNPPPPDPMQAKVMMLLPLVFTFLFLKFPAGLVLYWVINNVLSIVQQWSIMRKVETAPASKK